jgi:organic hydroperoxide reductase OsmC/OhrA
MGRSHRYELSLCWTGNLGSGTSGYRAYGRDHEVSAAGKPVIAASSDPAFRGDPARWNPEELLVASLAQCHLLWYLHLATTAGVVVVDYRDEPTGVMVEQDGGAGRFAQVVLRPRVTVAEPGMREAAHAVHARVGEYCFIARSVNFPVEHEPTTVVAPCA